MGQGQLGGVVHPSRARGGLSRYRIVASFVLTALFVAVKTFAHDYWSVGFGLAVLSIILLTPAGAEPAEPSEPWRAHALRVVSACFVVVTLASIVTTLSD